MKTPENTNNPPPPPPTNDERFLLRAMEGPCHPFAVLEALLKHPGRILYELCRGRASTVSLALLLILIPSLSIYGVVVGSLSGSAQMFIAPAKILLGSLVCALICLPSLFIFLCLGGADAKLRSVAGELLAMVALTALLLIGFAPVAWVFSQSTDSVALMATLHLTFWAIAVWFGLRLIGRSGSRRSSRVWIVIYVVVCLQMMTALRPIVGSAEDFFPGEKKFFIAHMLETLRNGPKNPAKSGTIR